MDELKIKKIADGADMIVKGYAFTQEEGLVRVFNLNDGASAIVMKPDGTMIETNMDEIQQMIVHNIWERDAKYMEAANA